MARNVTPLQAMNEFTQTLKILKMEMTMEIL